MGLDVLCWDICDAQNPEYLRLLITEPSLLSVTHVGVVSDQEHGKPQPDVTVVPMPAPQLHEDLTLFLENRLAASELRCQPSRYKARTRPIADVVTEAMRTLRSRCVCLFSKHTSPDAWCGLLVDPEIRRRDALTLSLDISQFIRFKQGNQALSLPSLTTVEPHTLLSDSVDSHGAGGPALPSPLFTLPPSQSRKRKGGGENRRTGAVVPEPAFLGQYDLAQCSLFGAANAGRVIGLRLGVPPSLEALLLDDEEKNLAKRRRAAEAATSAFGSERERSPSDPASAPCANTTGDAEGSYSDEQIYRLMFDALGDLADVAVLRALLPFALARVASTTYDGDVSNGITPHTRTIVQAIRVDDEHWGLLYIQLGPAGTGRRSADILYVDPLHPAPELRSPDLCALQRAFDPVRVEQCTVQYQIDEDVSPQCSGVWAVYLATELVSNHGVQPPVPVDRERFANELRSGQTARLSRWQAEDALVAPPPLATT
jgi:hypothetical protein